LLSSDHNTIQNQTIKVNELEELLLESGDLHEAQAAKMEFRTIVECPLEDASSSGVKANNFPNDSMNILKRLH
jgi:hypothetical protein